MSADTPAIEDAIARARQGDQDALVALLEQFQMTLRSSAERQLGVPTDDSGEVWDIVQQTCGEAQQQFASFTGSTAAQLTAWLQQILSRRLAETMRVDQTLQRPLPALEPAPNQIAHDETLVRADFGAPTELYKPQPAGEERLNRLLQLLDELPEDQREAIRLRHIQRWPLETIANKLVRTPAGVANLLRRGMAALRDRLPNEL
jgi:RNA polymerase sigma-70 factor (ECF subfamily)